VIDLSAPRDGLCARVEAAVAAGVDWVQVRDRSLDGAALLAGTEAVRDAARRGAAARNGIARVLVNRRVDVALAAGADGVHLGGDAMTPREARRLLGEAAWIGVSTHAPDEIDTASGADYAHLAPVFAPLSKASTRPPLGLRALARAAERGLPVMAQGGVEASRVRALIAAGASGVAVTGTLSSARDVGAAARALREALDASV
jgi:thiamine-phosphate pyrophosphorylase